MAYYHTLPTYGVECGSILLRGSEIDKRERVMNADQDKEMIEIMYSIMKSLKRIASALEEGEGK